MAQVRYSCPKCRAEILGPEACAVEVKLNCPTCQKSLRIAPAKPKPPEPPEPPPLPVITAEVAPRPRPVQSNPNQIVSRRPQVSTAKSLMRKRAEGKLIFFAIWLGPLGLLVLMLVGAIIQLVVAKSPDAQAEATFEIFGAIMLMVVLGLPWFCVGGFIASWLSPKFQASIDSTAKCSYCGQVNSLMGAWVCPCGYRDGQVKHAMTSRCPACKAIYQSIPCSRCDTLIFFR